MQGPFGSSTESTRRQALNLLKKVLEGYELHPFFFVLNTNLNAKADPPVLPVAHQTELLFRLAFRRPVRVLVGDEIGLGKTVEAMLAVKLLERRDGVRRVLVLVPRILVEQWRSELKRLGIRAKVVEKESLQSLPALAQQGFPEGWYVASIDLVKRKEHRPKIASVDWDVVIVDEAHRVGRIGSGRRSATLRYELVEDLARAANRNIILLSATPHRGNAADYISRLKLVDPYLVGDEKRLDDDSFYKLTRNSVVVRRTKADVNEIYERRQVFKNARFVAKVLGATPEEEKFSELLFRFLRDILLKYYEYTEKGPKALPLLLAIIARRASSSPYAAMLTLERMLRTRSRAVEGKAPSFDAGKLDEKAESIVETHLGPGFEDYDEAVEPDAVINEFAEKCGVLLEEQDLKAVEQLFGLAKTIKERGDSRLKGVLGLVREHLAKGDKVVVFTEYKDTAEYIYEKLKEERPSVVKETALITSKKTVIPGWGERERPSIEDLKEYLRRGEVKLVISTDVASEGLNLQVANVVINYEPTWSPVKVEQRLGRVWRLGQEKDVTGYTLFLATGSDKDVLEVLYHKLLLWGRALQFSRAPIGEEVVIDMMAKEGSTTIPIDEAKGTPKYSEYEALLSYIHHGRDGLERYVQGIVSSLKSLKENLERVGLTRKTDEFKREKLLSDVLGDFRGDGVERVLRELFVVTARLAGLNVEVKGDKVFAGEFMPKNIYDFYSSTVSLLSNAGSPGEPVYLVSPAQVEGLKELHLFKVTIFLKGKAVYSETVGVQVKFGSVELLRGRKLLDVIVKALSPSPNVWSIQEYYANKQELQKFVERAKTTVLREVARAAAGELIEYVSELEKSNFSALHQNWEPRDLSTYRSEAEHLGTIFFTKSSKASAGEAVPPIEVEKVEEEAMRLAMEYERESGRLPEDVSMREHFDILSRDPETGEVVRFIEVKGKSGLDLEIELTEPEFKVAKEKGEKYWLYIVREIGTGKPRLLAVQDPVNNVKWIEVCIKRYRFRPE